MIWYMNTITALWAKFIDAIMVHGGTAAALAPAATRAAV